MGIAKILDDSYKSRDVRVYGEYAPTLRTSRCGFKVVYLGEKSDRMYGIIKREPIKDKIPLSVIELFSGIGAQNQGIKNTGLFDCNVIVTADIAKESIISYAAVHKGLTPKIVEDYTENGIEPSMGDMIAYLKSHKIGYNFEDGKDYDWEKYKQDVKKYYVACKLSNNIGDIAGIDLLPYVDLWTYSFPCTDISQAGEQRGIIRGVTRSGLLYEVERLLKVAREKGTLPKYLMLENVKHLLSRSFKSVYDEWTNVLDELGYVTYTKVLNAKDYGIPQNRERVFGVSIRKDIMNGEFVFPFEFDGGVRLENILDKDVDPCYDCTGDVIEYFKSSDNFNDIEGLENGDYILRRLTPNESWRLMGFDDEAYKKVKGMCVSDTKMYEQAGNSIVTNCIELIFEHLYKAQYDRNFVTTDEIKTGNVINWC